MEHKKGEMQCALCGYTSSGKFVGDICPDCGLTYWKCHNCGYTITAAVPPGVCPECKEKCDFLNITCYTPECGGPGHIDPRLQRQIATTLPLFTSTRVGAPIFNREDEVAQGSQIRMEADIIEIKSILYPTDLLGYSQHVLPYVLLMSEKHDAEVYLLYVVRDLHHYTGFQVPHTSISAFTKEALEGAEKLMDRICDQHLQSCPVFRRKVVVGDPGHEIVKTIESQNIDLIIMGSHGRQRPERTLFGSVAGYVVRHSSMPALVVNPHRLKGRQ